MEILGRPGMPIRYPTYKEWLAERTPPGKDMIFAVPNTIETLKRQAKALKKEKLITHSAALAEVAKTYGFRDYAHAQQWFELNRPREIQQDPDYFQIHRK